MTDFSFSGPRHVFFGAGGISRIPGIAERHGFAAGGGRVLVLTDAGVEGFGFPAKIADGLQSSGRTVRFENGVPREPAVEDVDALADGLRGENIAGVVAVGGGSVLDTAKFLSVLIPRGGKAADLVNAGVPGPGLPCLMVPTTAGTGAEATPNAIVAVREKGLKIGVVSPFFIPDYVVLDAEVTKHLPPALTASTGVDAYCHALECFISKKANPHSDTIALEGLRLLDRSIREAFRNGENLEARADMLLGSFYGGLSIASSGTTAVHALSYPLGGKYRIPHGVANAILLLPVMEFNRDAAEEKLARAARTLGLASGKNVGDASRAMIERIGNMTKELRIPASLSGLGIPASDFPQLAESAFGVKRLLDNNPKHVSRADIEAIYERIR